MIWTVILKDGISFVVNGSTYNTNWEIERALKARGHTNSDVAGVVRGNHPVIKYPDPFVSPFDHHRNYSSQVKSAMSAPRIQDRDTQEELSDIVFDSGALPNDPIDW